MAETLLELEDVEARYGPVKALRGITLSVGEGEVVAVLGANGAGKTTTLRAVSGTVRRGIARTFQNVELFGDEQRLLRHFPWLGRRGDQRAGTLSGGEQQMLALARALMLRPKLVLLDEPSLGLAPMVVSELFRIVRELNDREGLAVLVVEQNASLALEASSRAYVLEVGRVAVAGESGELGRHESLRRSYLGY